MQTTKIRKWKMMVSWILSVCLLAGVVNPALVRAEENANQVEAIGQAEEINEEENIDSEEEINEEAIYGAVATAENTGYDAWKDVPMTDWMACIDDETNLSGINIPGTHDSGMWNLHMYVKLETVKLWTCCQDVDLKGQMERGARYFDLRMDKEDEDEELSVWHGPYEASITGFDDLNFDECVEYADKFLKEHPKECIIYEISHENDPPGTTALIRKEIRNLVNNNPKKYCLIQEGEMMPTLGEVRGKLVFAGLDNDFIGSLVNDYSKGSAKKIRDLIKYINNINEDSEAQILSYKYSGKIIKGGQDKTKVPRIIHASCYKSISESPLSNVELVNDVILEDDALIPRKGAVGGWIKYNFIREKDARRWVSTNIRGDIELDYDDPNLMLWWNTIHEGTDMVLVLSNKKSKETPYLFDYENYCNKLKNFTINNYDDQRYARNKVPEKLVPWFREGIRKIRAVSDGELSEVYLPPVADYMFAYGDNLKSVEGSLRLDKTISAKGLFAGCAKLNNVEFVGDASNLKDASHMFHDCCNLKNVDFYSDSNKNEKKDIFKNLENISGMFAVCQALQHTNFFKYDLNNVRDVSELILNTKCSDINIYEGILKQKFENATDFSRTFSNTSFKALDLSSWSPKNVENMEEMFYYIEDIEIIKIPNFNTRNMWNLKKAFSMDWWLRKLYVSKDKWSIENVSQENMSDAFYYCTSLRGGFGTTTWDKDCEGGVVDGYNGHKGILTDADLILKDIFVKKDYIITGQSGDVTINSTDFIDWTNSKLLHDVMFAEKKIYPKIYLNLYDPSGNYTNWGAEKITVHCDDNHKAFSVAYKVDGVGVYDDSLLGYSPDSEEYKKPDGYFLAYKEGTLNWGSVPGETYMYDPFNNGIDNHIKPNLKPGYSIIEGTAEYTYVDDNGIEQTTRENPTFNTVGEHKVKYSFIVSGSGVVFPVEGTATVRINPKKEDLVQKIVLNSGYKEVVYDPDKSYSVYDFVSLYKGIGSDEGASVYYDGAKIDAGSTVKEKLDDIAQNYQYKDAGTYKHTISIKKLGYEIFEGTFTLKINKAEIKCYVTDIDVEYDVNSHLPKPVVLLNGKVTNRFDDRIVYGKGSAGNYFIHVDDPEHWCTEVGEYNVGCKVNLTPDEENNYTENSEDLYFARVKIRQANPEHLHITVQGYTGIYDGQAHSLSISNNGVAGLPGGANIKYYTDEGRTNELSVAPEVKDVKDSKIVYYTITKENYDPINGVARITILPKSISANMLDVKFIDKTEDDGEPDWVYLKDKGSMPGIKATFKDGGKNVNLTFTDAPQKNDPNFKYVKKDNKNISSGIENRIDFTISAEGDSEHVYNYTGSTTKSLFVICSDIRDYIKATSYKGVYDGNPHSISVNWIPGIGVSEPGSIKYEYRTTENGAYSETKPTFTDAGVKTVYYKVSANGCADVFGQETVTIEKANIKGISYQGFSGEYDGEYHGITVNYNHTGFEIAYYDENGKAIDNKYIEPGEYKVRFKITPTGENAKNYNEYEGEATVEIYNGDFAEEDVKVLVKDHVYDGNDYPSAEDYENGNIIIHKPEGAVIKYGYSQYNCDLDTIPTNSVVSHANNSTSSEVDDYVFYYAVSMKGKNTYYGQGTYKINPADITGKEIRLWQLTREIRGDVILGDNFYYNEQSHTVLPAIDGKIFGFREFRLLDSSDNNTQVDKGTYNLEFEAIGNYTGTASCKWKIEACAQCEQNGHEFGEWIEMLNSDGDEVYSKVRFCKICDYGETAISRVNYDANGGLWEKSRITDSNEYIDGSVVNVIFENHPVREGYTFMGWSRKANAIKPDYTGTGKKSFVIGIDSVTLYAVWKKSGEDMPNEPVITKNPVDMETTKGQAVTLSVEVEEDKDEILTYQWYKCSSPKDYPYPSRSELLTGKTGASFTEDAATAGAKYYYCVVTNTKNAESASVVSNLATVYVHSDDPADYVSVVFKVNPSESNEGFEYYKYNKILKNSRIVNPGDPDIAGFSAWYKNQSCSRKWNFDEDTVTKDTVIYTNQADTALVSFSANGGQFTSAVHARRYGVGQLVERPVTEPVNGNYVFSGWYKDEDATTPWDFNEDTVTGDVTIYAGWGFAAGEDSSDMSVVKVPDCIYTGKKITPNVIVTANGQILKQNVDYTVSYKNNINVHTGIANNGIRMLADGTIDTSRVDTMRLPLITIKGKGNYSGSTINLNFNILPVSLGTSGTEEVTKDVTADIINKYATNTKSAITVKPVIKYNGKVLKVKKDYVATLTTVSANSVSGPLESGLEIEGLKIPKGFKGTFKLTVSALGNYDGGFYKTITVEDNAKTLEKAKITVKKIPYTGSDLTVKDLNDTGRLTVKDGSRVLTYGTDYTVSFSEPYVAPGTRMLAGSYPIAIDGIGDYAGTRRMSQVTVTGMSVSKAKAVLKDAKPVYTGRHIGHNIKSLSIDTKVNGEKQVNVLRSGIDYTLKVTGDVKAGKATVTITGKGAYSGTKKVTYKIQKKLISANNISDVVVLANGNVDLGKQEYYGGFAVEPLVSISYNGVKLKDTADYSIKYSNNKNAGASAKAVITGKGNYTGKINCVFTISDRTINPDKIDIDDAKYKVSDKIYTGEEVKLSEKDIEYVNIRINKDGAYLTKTLKLGTDYEIVESSYRRNVNIGNKATVIIKGKGDFDGYKTVTFKIVKKEFSWWKKLTELF